MTLSAHAIAGSESGAIWGGSVVNEVDASGDASAESRLKAVIDVDIGSNTGREADARVRSDTDVEGAFQQGVS